MKFDTRLSYILHLLAITATLFFVGYYGFIAVFGINNYNSFLMFAWFFCVLYLADNIWEAVFKV